ncbi:MAG: DNA-formamidopyrimidine glycosylase, partial [Bacilli bacterium]|nr:DNA-formamidopyrimidine glycosylase [Bacilli bacterium]
MPEIAEVETVRQTLRKRILRKKIKNVNVLYE